MQVLYHKNNIVHKELRSLAGGLSLSPRPKEKGAQADGRIALLWLNMQAKSYRRSAGAKDNVFNPDTDRLVAALAVLDSKAVAEGKWLGRDAKWDLPLPARWTTPKARGGLGGFPAGWNRTQAIGPSLAGITPIEAGHFTGEQLGWEGYRAAAEIGIAVWMHKHPKDRVIVLMVYEYDKDKNPRCPASYRYYAISETGTLDVQIDAGGGKSGRGIEIVRDKGEVVFPLKSNFP